jgi:hypothetical protein
MTTVKEQLKNLDPACIQNIPTVFIAQTQFPIQKFQVTGAMVEKRLVTLQIEEIVIIDNDTLTMKMKFFMVAKRTDEGLLELVEQRRGGQDTPVPGFNSTRIVVRRDGGEFDVASFEALYKMAEWQATVIEEQGENALYAAGNSKTRLYILPQPNTASRVQFNIVQRPNPQTGSPTVGIENVSFKGMVIGGSGVGRTEEIQEDTGEELIDMDELLVRAKALAAPAKSSKGGKNKK